MSTDFMIRRQAYNLFLKGHGYKITTKKLDQNEHTVRDWFRRFNAKAFDSLLTPEKTKNAIPQQQLKTGFGIKVLTKLRL